MYQEPIHGTMECVSQFNIWLSIFICLPGDIYKFIKTNTWQFIFICPAAGDRTTTILAVSVSGCWLMIYALGGGRGEIAAFYRRHLFSLFVLSFVFDFFFKRISAQVMKDLTCNILKPPSLF